MREHETLYSHESKEIENGKMLEHQRTLTRDQFNQHQCIFYNSLGIVNEDEYQPKQQRADKIISKQDSERFRLKFGSTASGHGCKSKKKSEATTTNEGSFEDKKKPAPKNPEKKKSLGTGEYYVEKILGTVHHNNELLFKTRWKNCGEEEDTCEPEGSFVDEDSCKFKQHMFWFMTLASFAFVYLYFI